MNDVTLQLGNSRLVLQDGDSNSYRRNNAIFHRETPATAHQSRNEIDKNSAHRLYRNIKRD